MRRVVVAVRVAIVALVMVLGLLAQFSAEVIPAQGGARFIGGQFYAPGRFPGDGRTK